MNPSTNLCFSTAIPRGYTEQTATVSAAAPAEKDLIAFLRDYSGRTGLFPPTFLDFEQTLSPIVSKINSATQPLPPADLMQMIVQAGRVMMLLNQLPTADWHYAGRNVKPASPDAATKPIFWYHPKSTDTWRIIYANLHTADVPAHQAPTSADETQPPIR